MTFLYKISEIIVYCLLKILISQLRIVGFHICFAQPFIKTLQENLGHATAAFTMDVYGHVSRQMQLNSASKLESFIQNINEKVSLMEEGTTMQD